ncbi:MAG: hypothetical protein ACRDMH_01160 [Solirubrobacterales bacterium]
MDDCGALAVGVQGDRKIVLAGESPPKPGHSNDLALARLLPNGDLDNSFSGNGRAAIGFENGHRQDWGSGLAIQPDGGIVVAGVSQQVGGRDFAVARFDGN